MARLIHPTVAEPVTAPTADELQATYDTLDKLWDTIHATTSSVELDEQQEQHAQLDRDVIKLARSIVHQHLLVTRYPNQCTTHYRVDADEVEPTSLRVAATADDPDPFCPVCGGYVLAWGMDEHDNYDGSAVCGGCSSHLIRCRDCRTLIVDEPDRDRCDACATGDAA